VDAIPDATAEQRPITSVGANSPPTAPEPNVIEVASIFSSSSTTNRLTAMPPWMLRSMTG